MLAPNVPPGRDVECLMFLLGGRIALLITLALIIVTLF